MLNGLYYQKEKLYFTPNELYKSIKSAKTIRIVVTNRDMGGGWGDRVLCN